MFELAGTLFELAATLTFKPKRWNNDYEPRRQHNGQFGAEPIRKNKIKLIQHWHNNNHKNDITYLHGNLLLAH
jgi:hypothetical protein